jgi:hypothetical protein
MTIEQTSHKTLPIPLSVSDRYTRSSNTAINMARRSSIAKQNNDTVEKRVNPVAIQEKNIAEVYEKVIPTSRKIEEQCLN